MQARSHQGHERQVRFKVSARLLDHLGLAMYSSVPKAISELVVNGYDADASYITVTSGHETIVVEDNGSGMSEARIEQFLTLASGDKRRRGRTPVYHRDPVGAKGIGKLAGLGIARRVDVATWQDGSMSSFSIDRDDFGATGVSGTEVMLDRAPMILRVSQTSDAGSGTRVTMRKLRPEARFVPAKVREHLAAELPLSDTFRVVVDGETLRKDEVKGRRIPIAVDDPVCGRIEGYLVVATAAVANPGVLTTVRGRAVGGPSFFNLRLASRRYHSTDRIAGQIEVADLDPDDGTPSAIKTDREGFLLSHPRYEAYAAFMTARLEEVARELEDHAEAETDARRRRKLGEAVARATAVLNAFTEHERRLFQVAGGPRRPAEPDPEADRSIAAPPPRPEPVRPTPITPPPAPGQLALPDATEPPAPEPVRERPPRPLRDPAIVPVNFGPGRLRFRSRVLGVEVAHLGPDAPECELRAAESLLLVNQDHPAYEEAERGGWVEGVVLRAVATRLACDHSSTAGEAYALLDEIIRFAAAHESRRRRITLAEAISDDGRAEVSAAS